MATTDNSPAGALVVKRCQLCPGKERKSEAEEVCKTCQVYLCTDCVDLHIMDCPFKQTPVKLRFLFYEMYSLKCTDHEELICGMFCWDCNRAICELCLYSGYHKNHTIKHKINPLDKSQHLKQCQICPGKVRKSLADRKCNTCNVNLCQNCLNLHMTHHSVKHDIVTFRHTFFQSYQLPCTVHKELECDEFCEDCNVALCKICVKSRSHANHNVVQRQHQYLQERNPSSRRFTAKEYIEAILKFLLFLSIIFAICFYGYRSRPKSGEFCFEETPWDLTTTCHSCFKSYRGATLTGYFKTKNIFRIGVKYEDIWSNKNNSDSIVMFQIGVVQQESLDLDNNIGLLDGIFVSVKYYKGFKCLVVENGTSVLLRRKVSYLSGKLCYHDILSFEMKNENLYIHYDIQNTTLVSLDLLSLTDLKRHSFIAGLGHPSFALVAMTLYGTTLSNKFHKDIRISSKGKVLSNYYVGPEFKSSFANIPIHNTTRFDRSFIEFKVRIFFKPNSYYVNKGKKDLYELGLAPKKFISSYMPLRNAKNTAFIQVKLESHTSLAGKLHFYTWENGRIRHHFELICQTKKSVMLYFLFYMNSEDKQIEFVVYDYGGPRNAYHLYHFKNLDFNNTLYPSVRKETSKFPIKIFYKIW